MRGGFIEQFGRCGNADRAVRKETAPYPIVVLNYAWRLEMRPIIQCVTVSYYNDVMILRNG
jgi:hypothetical protein